MMKVLSVDDSAIMRRIIRSATEVLGFDFAEAGNGQEALELLEKEEVNVIILDWNMPVMDGYSTLLAIRENPAYQKIPVIMVTTESEKTNIIKAIKAGAQQYFTKPFSQEDLLARLVSFAQLI